MEQRLDELHFTGKADRQMLPRLYREFYERGRCFDSALRQTMAPQEYARLHTNLAGEIAPEREAEPAVPSVEAEAAPPVAPVRLEAEDASAPPSISAVLVGPPWGLRLRGLTPRNDDGPSGEPLEA